MINFTETLIILNIKKPNPIMVLLYIERKQKNGSKSCFCFFMITDGKQHKARLFDIITLRIEIVGGAAMDQHPVQGGVEIFLVASCYRNRDNLRPDEPLGSFADFTYLYLPLPLQFMHTAAIHDMNICDLNSPWRDNVMICSQMKSQALITRGEFATRSLLYVNDFQVMIPR